ncbi:DUF4097 family beta strand repeat-containing protein [Oceanobacillus massiliensis]|uniref:DUF4097 family beta strand repeat-containing protein n=1 Tax=Oceanobacillus massiliensis TaxID=1465765 RepID=UPI000289BECF|nr:DUF4097 family beta strand repeat-containing protein [Oceanobacillus massiliensis]
MFNLKKVSLVALILLVVGLVGSLLTFHSVSSTQVETEETIKDQFQQIDISTDNARVEILPADSNVATVKFSGNDEDNRKYDFNTNVEGDTLRINVKERGFRFFSFDFSFSTPSLKVYIPEKMYQTVNVESNNGRITAIGLQSDDISAKTNNGKIEFNNVVSSAMRAETDNGEIRLENIEGEVSGRTNNGGISLITDRIDRPINFETDNGRIAIHTEKEPVNTTLDIKTDNGKVTVFGDSNWDAVAGNGENKVKLTTNNGSITIGN